MGKKKKAIVSDVIINSESKMNIELDDINQNLLTVIEEIVTPQINDNSKTEKEELNNNINEVKESGTNMEQTTFTEAQVQAMITSAIQQTQSNVSTSAGFSAMDDIDAQRELQKDKDWKLNETAKLNKEFKKELSLINNAKDERVKAFKIELEEQYKPVIEQLKSAHKTALKPFQLLSEEVMGGVGTAIGDKTADIIKSSPVNIAIEGVGTFLGRFKK